MKKTFDYTEYQIFNDFIQMSQKILKQVMSKALHKHYGKENIIETKNFIIAKGNIPVGLVAHLDTVFSEPPTNIFCDWRKGVMWSPEGLGADDRAGVFAIIKILLEGYRPTVILTTDEEKGGLGAAALAKRHPKNFLNLKYLIELDRCGSDDCVFYFDDNMDFVQYVESFGFKESYGTYSDICEICPVWGISGVNLSIGYYSEHTYTERLHIFQMYNTIEKVINMLIEASDDEVPTFEYIELTELKYRGLYYPYGFTQVKCAKCGNEFSDFDTIPVYTRDNKIIQYCADCLPNDINWCKECGEATEGDDLCWKCEQKMMQW